LHPLEELIEILDLEQLEVNLFRGNSPDENRQRVFGGQVAGQALVAACRTVERGSVHSLHAYFLLPGDPKVPIVYQVDRIRDGRSFATRRVSALQHGRAIFHLSASFHVSEAGVSHQRAMPEVPDPETLPTWRERVAEVRDQIPPEWRKIWERDRPIDVRHLGPLGIMSTEPAPPERFVWLRADGRLPDHPELHQCVFAYASDMTLLDTALLPHGISWSSENFMMASLDHALWFHDSFRADEWLLYAQVSPRSGSARGFSRGELFTRDGTLVASVAQEGLIRSVAGEG
jgi:acyl-CoA thioesterase-2